MVTKDVMFYSLLWKADQTPKRKGKGMFYWNPKNHEKLCNKRGISFAMKTLIFFQFSQTNWPPNAQTLDNAIHWINHCSGKPNALSTRWWFIQRIVLSTFWTTGTRSVVCSVIKLNQSLSHETFSHWPVLLYSSILHSLISTCKISTLFSMHFSWYSYKRRICFEITTF